jgi:hypothetical protein
VCKDTVSISARIPREFEQEIEIILNNCNLKYKDKTHFLVLAILHEIEKNKEGEAHEH